MELKTARLTLLIDPNKKAAFERLCAQQDRTASQVVRQLIREYLVAHGVSYVASGTPESDGEAPEPAAAAPAPERAAAAAAPAAPAPRRRSAPRPKAAPAVRRR
jgi:hypothetical protein